MAEQDTKEFCVGSRLPLLAGSEFVKILRPIPITDMPLCTEEKQCPLCAEVYESSDEVPCMLPCAHVFGRGCIENWVSEARANKYTCPMCRRLLFATFTHDIDQRRQRLVRSAIADARKRGIRSDVELYEVLRLRGSKLTPRDPQVAALDDGQDVCVTKELIALDTFVFEMPAQLRDSAQWIAQLGGQYYGLLNISGFWKQDWVTIFPRKFLRYHLQTALTLREDLKIWRCVIQEFLDRDLAQERLDPDLDQRMIDDKMIQEVLARQLPPIVLDGNGIINPELIDRNMVQFVLDRDLLQDYIGRGPPQQDAKLFVLAKDIVEKFMLRRDCLGDVRA